MYDKSTTTYMNWRKFVAKSGDDECVLLAVTSPMDIRTHSMLEVLSSVTTQIEEMEIIDEVISVTNVRSP